MANNSNPRAVMGDNSVGADIDDGQLLAFVERIERVEESISEAQEDRKEIYAEAKSFGYDVKVLRKVLARRRADQDKLAEEQTLIDLYEQAIERQGRRAG